jgi:hypothetical protein
MRITFGDLLKTLDRARSQSFHEIPLRKKVENERECCKVGCKCPQNCVFVQIYPLAYAHMLHTRERSKVVRELSPNNLTC